MINASIEKALYYVTGNGNFQHVSLEELEKIANEYPYFGVPQLLLATKMKLDQHTGLQEQVQKTALFFPNIPWLHYQLSTDLLRQPVVKFKERLGVEEVEEVEKVEEVQEVEGVEEVEVVQEVKEVQVVEDVAEVERVEEVMEENEISQQEEEMASIVQESGKGVEAFLEEAENEGLTKNANAIISEQDDNKEPEVLDEHEMMFRNIKAMLDVSAVEASGKIGNSSIPMDPYHTIDYFASQGIKLDLDNNPQDKLGKQLKKFTHWLRHMKKLGPEDALEEINKSNDEEDIQNFANSSNAVKEVVTEAMAMVLEKQGKLEKAIQLYEKLSFLNHDKSAYFADKIKKLNNT